jgi:hypothetical protein
VRQKCHHYVKDVAFISNKELGMPSGVFAQMPIPTFENGKFFIYFTSRNSSNQSKPMVAEVNLAELCVAKEASPVPLDLGSPGNFDDDGIMPSSIIDTKMGKMMYYIGWNRAVSVPYRLSIGLALKTKDSHNFAKFSQGPIIDRSPSNPYFVTTPHVSFENEKFEMLMSVGTNWISHEGRTESIYSTMRAVSGDGIHWDQFEDINLGITENPICIARPFGSDSHIYFSQRRIRNFREKNAGYRIRATRISDNLDKENCTFEWNSINDDRDRAYASLMKFNGKRYLFYNGEEFGRFGIHIAEETIIME